MSTHRITLTQNARGRIIQNVFHVNNPDGALSDVQIKDEVVNNWIQVIKPHTGLNLTYIGLEIRVVGVAAPPAATHFVLNIPGTGSSTNLPQVCCVKLGFLTGLSGRKFRGRYYIGLIGNVTDQTDLITGTPMANLEATAATLQARWAVNGSGPLTLVIFHRGPEAPPPTLVTQIIVRATLGVQRRRNLGVGI